MKITEEQLNQVIKDLSIDILLEFEDYGLMSYRGDKLIETDLWDLELEIQATQPYTTIKETYLNPPYEERGEVDCYVETFQLWWEGEATELTKQQAEKLSNAIQKSLNYVY